MPKETEKGKKVTGTNKRGEAECAREGITLPLIQGTDSSETENPQGNNACRDASSWVRMIINWIGNNTHCFLVYMISSDV